MSNKTIIFIPGKNPKPPAEAHTALLKRTLLEGVRRASPDLFEAFDKGLDFRLIAWNLLYYDVEKDPGRDLLWIDNLINIHGPSDEDIKQANSWHKKLIRLSYNIADLLPQLLRLMPREIRENAEGLKRYFQNSDNVACKIRALLKQSIIEAQEQGHQILLIGHSMGSVIAYDTLWELSHEVRHPARVDLLTLGSPLGMRYVQRRLQGYQHTGRQRYPVNIRTWSNLSSVGDVVAVDRHFHDDFAEMLELGVIEKIEDHCEGIYNYFHNEQGLNCHRSYGYLVNPAVGSLIADWWRAH